MENNLHLKIFPAAQSDLEQIFQYISAELCNPTAAIELIDAFEKALDNVCAFSQICPLATDSEIQVIRVIYGMRNFADIL